VEVLAQVLPPELGDVVLVVEDAVPELLEPGGEGLGVRPVLSG